MMDIRTEVLGNLWCNSTAYQNTEYVVDNIGNRFMGTESEAKAKDYILGLFEEYGLEDPHIEPYKYTGWKRKSCSVNMVSPVKRGIDAFTHPHSASSPPKGVEGEVINIGKGCKRDFEKYADKIPGKIVMVTTGWYPGESYFSAHRTGKHGWTVDYGGIGLIIRNETPGGLIETGTIAAGYRTTGEIPVVGVSFENGAFIERQLKKGPTRIKMMVSNETMPDTVGWNIVGDIVGEKHPERKVLIGAHYDGHDIGPEAASDDILGAMTMLDVARALAKFKGKFKNTMRFVAFGNEECWTVGSVNYVAKHENDMKNILLMINGDGLGRRPDPCIMVSNPPELVSPLSRLVEEKGIDAPVIGPDPLLPTWGATSDNHPFLMKGVPTMSISGRRSTSWTTGRGADVRDHTIADTLDKIDNKLVKQNAMLIADIMMIVAQSDEHLVRHYTEEEVLEAVHKCGYVDALKAQRRWHPDSVLGIPPKPNTT